MNPLPLRLTPFEQSMWVDDSPAYPVNILYRLEFSGTIERTPFEQALRAVMKRHPLLAAKISESWTRRSYWKEIHGEAASRPLPLSWNEHRFGKWPAPCRLQLAAGESLQVWVHSADAESEVLLQFHHVATDGVGAMGMIDELLQLYAAAVNGAQPDLPPLDAKRLKRRGKYGYSLVGLLKIAPKLLRGVEGIRQFLGRKAVPIVPHDAARRAELMPASYPQLRAHTFTAAETTALRVRAQRDQATMNDILARDLFLTLHDWRRRRGMIDDAWLRLLIPVDMRKADDDSLPAMNCVSLVFLDRRPSDAGDPAALLRSVHDEMQLIKQNHLGLIYLLLAWATDVLPGMMIWLAKVQKFSCSAIFSNLVRPLDKSPLPRDDVGDLRVGSTTLRGLEFYPPLRPYMCVAYGAVTYAGRLTLALNADPRFLSPNDANELLADFATRVNATLAAGSGT